MTEKEASARIKINRLLEAAGWRFFDEVSGPANIRLEPQPMSMGTDTRKILTTATVIKLISY